jgi:hypothetical protein
VRPPAHHQLDALTTELTERIEQWRATVRRLAAEPGDADSYARAIDRRLERDAHVLTAHRPGWLMHLIEERPADVAGATAWDDALRDIADWRARRPRPDHVSGLGDRPHDRHSGRQWDSLNCPFGVTRV